MAALAGTEEKQLVWEDFGQAVEDFLSASKCFWKPSGTSGGGNREAEEVIGG